MKSIINLLFHLWSFIPVLTLTDDNNFDEFIPFRKNKSSTLRNWRFSLINIKLGLNIVYIITFTKTDFKIIEILSFKSIQSGCSLYEKGFKKHLEKLNKRYMKVKKEIVRYQNQTHNSKLIPPSCSVCEEELKNYLERVDNQYLEDEIKFENNLDQLDDKSSFEVLKESLRYRIQIEQSRINTAVNKATLYTSILLTVFVPILVSHEGVKAFVSSWFNVFLTVVASYSFLNTILYIYGNIKVQSVSYSTFENLTESDNKSKTIVLQYWKDWQELKRKANTLVSYILNLEKWIIGYFISIVILVVRLRFNQGRIQ